ncbi:MAG TPA: GNAT family N-acetyltransferase [Dehalococcoidia bacterium]|nr:GNAT family N-acetyltransferase [Dehalococcoidia bacterium]
MDGITFKLVENDSELEGAFEVRRVVFVEEQDIDEDEEYDGLDHEALQMVAKRNDEIIGTARVRFLGEDKAKIERMAVLKSFRRRGIGSGMMSFLTSELEARYIRHVVLHAQYIVIPFYESCGYSSTGSPFWEAGIKHIAMEKRIPG